MLHPWTRFLPLFLVERMARKYGERMAQGGSTLFCGPKGVFFLEAKPVSVVGHR